MAGSMHGGLQDQRDPKMLARIHAQKLVWQEL